MTVTEQPFEFDDELLSAYLDDELPPDERARVEERLAADPAARRLLEELRSVSRVMQELPPEKLSADLRDSVLRRAERAMLVSGERASARGPGDVVRSIPFGRSKRAWLWAGAAIAAGLMLMIFERRPDENGDLPRQVALQDRVERDRSDADKSLEMRALESPSSPAAATASDGIVALKPELQPVEELESTAVPPSASMARRAVPAPAPARENAVIRDEVAFRSGGGVGGSRVSRSESTVLDAVKPNETAGFASMIVNVQCSPVAMQNRTYDALLEKNQIDVDPPAADTSKPSDLQNVDVLVVEAQPAQVYSCIKDISADQLNYVAINVEERSPTSQKDQAAKEPTLDVQQYNRGRFQNQQQVEMAPSNDRYYYSTNNGGPQIGLRFKSEEKTESPSSDQSALAYGFKGQAEQAPMAKMSASAAKPSSAEGPAGGAAIESRAADNYLGGELQENLARRASQKLATKADMLQVLFVFQCPTDSPAPESGSASAAAPATAAPAEKGIEEQ